MPCLLTRFRIVIAWANARNGLYFLLFRFRQKIFLFLQFQLYEYIHIVLRTNGNDKVTNTGIYMLKYTV